MTRWALLSCPHRTPDGVINRSFYGTCHGSRVSATEWTTLEVLTPRIDECRVAFSTRSRRTVACGRSAQQQPIFKKFHWNRIRTTTLLSPGELLSIVVF